MATRGTIGYETADGGYVGVYVHYDSYPDHMGPNLHRMFHTDVVIMVNKALRQGGIRCINNDGSYEIFNDKGYAAETTWPCCPEEYAYRKRLDGRLEIVTHRDLTPIEWSGR